MKGDVLMDFPQFEKQIGGDDTLSTLILEVAREIGTQIPTEGTGRYVAVADDVLISLAAYALFRWAKDYFDYRRAQNETEIAERRVRIIQGLVADGFEPEKAQAVTEGLLKQIAKRTEDDPVLQKAVKLIGTGES